jgi:hypothetical protein
MTALVKLDAVGLDWLVRDARALDERLLEQSDPRQVREAVGRALSELVRISSRL